MVSSSPRLAECFGYTQVKFLFFVQDPNLARQLLAQAGYVNDVPAGDIYPNSDVETAVAAQNVDRDLVQAGIPAEAIPVSPVDLDSHFGSGATFGLPVLGVLAENTRPFDARMNEANHSKGSSV
jgi:hypothetical protein